MGRSCSERSCSSSDFCREEEIVDLFGWTIEKKSKAYFATIFSRASYRRSVKEVQ